MTATVTPIGCRRGPLGCGPLDEAAETNIPQPVVVGHAPCPVCGDAGPYCAYDWAEHEQEHTLDGARWLFDDVGVGGVLLDMGEGRYWVVEDDDIIEPLRNAEWLAGLAWFGWDESRLTPPARALLPQLMAKLRALVDERERIELALDDLWVDPDDARGFASFDALLTACETFLASTAPMAKLVADLRSVLNDVARLPEGA